MRVQPTLSDIRQVTFARPTSESPSLESRVLRGTSLAQSIFMPIEDLSAFRGLEDESVGFRKLACQQLVVSKHKRIL